MLMYCGSVILTIHPARPYSVSLEIVRSSSTCTVECISESWFSYTDRSRNSDIQVVYNLRENRLRTLFRNRKDKWALYDAE
jgi:hypothetical protein